MIRLTLAASFIVMLSPSESLAAPTRSLGQFNDWSASSYVDGDAQRCFIASRPETEKPSNLRHGEVFFFVQNAKDGDTESSFQAGYNFAENSSVTITIGEDRFRMLTRGSNAWLASLEREPALLAAMKAGDSMVLEAHSGRGNATTYIFSLTGVTAASRVLERCNSDPA